jgi:hypothetical protein
LIVGILAFTFLSSRETGLGSAFPFDLPGLPAPPGRLAHPIAQSEIAPTTHH